MIERYTLPEMGSIWTEENKFNTFLQVEVAVCEAYAELGQIPQESMAVIKERAGFETQRINEIEAEVKHDIIAFLTSVAEHVGEDSRFIHMGMTSSDLLDTGLALQLKQAGQQLLRRIDTFLDALGKRANEFKYTPIMGRSHGVHAEPTTFGLKLALFYDEMQRNKRRMLQAVETVSAAKISGAVGTYAFIDPVIERMTAERLDLQPVHIANQVIQRDNHAEFLAAIAIIGATIEKLAVEIRGLQRTETHEAEEYFSKGQKGSSAMPHKRNPITCERLTGMARLLRANAHTAMENVALWHERDISHSSVERVIIPDSTIVLDYMLHLAADLIEKLIVYPDNMLANMKLSHNVVFSQPLLLALIRTGITREEGYRLVQRNAMACYEKNTDFRDQVRSDEEITALLTDEDLDRCFQMENFTKHVDYIFQQVGIDG